MGTRIEVAFAAPGSILEIGIGVAKKFSLNEYKLLFTIGNVFLRRKRIGQSMTSCGMTLILHLHHLSRY